MVRKGENSESKGLAGASGFTLIEVMIALVVLMVGLLALLQLQVAAINGLAYSRHFSVATQLAEAQIEKLMKYPLPQNEAGDQNYYPVDEDGNNISAENHSGGVVSPFYDVMTISGSQSFGDHLATRIWSPTAVNEKGLPAHPGEVAYVVCWTVERGGANGSPALTGKSYGSPGPYQVTFVVSALWFDKGDKVNAFSYVRPADTDPLWSKRTSITGMRLLDPR
jgi:prepilin-type N-terminal cleavage/methylation domain-containing protein